MLNSEVVKRHIHRLRRNTNKIRIFCDFDGTITQVDATDAVLETFALPAWREWEQRWINGEITSQECLSRQVELIRADQDTIIHFVEDLPIDEGIIELDRRCTEQHVPLTIVSDGLDLIVEAVLRRHGLLHIPVFSNHLRWNEHRHPVLSYPFSVQGCESGAGTCKCALTWQSDSSSFRTVYIGDGRSDQCVSLKMQTLFAKGALRKWCQTHRVVHTPFETLTDVTKQIFAIEEPIQ